MGAEGSAVRIGLREAVALLVLVSGTVATFTSVQVQLQSADHRITTLEANEVPRSEQQSQEAERRRRESDWSERLNRIESKLDAVLLSRRR